MDELATWNASDVHIVNDEGNDTTTGDDIIAGFHNFLDTTFSEIFATRGTSFNVKMTSGFLIGQRAITIGSDETVSMGREFLRSIYGEMEAFENYFDVQSHGFSFTVTDISENGTTALSIKISNTENDRYASMVVSFP
jgi:hypothetical protein